MLIGTKKYAKILDLSVFLENRGFFKGVRIPSLRSKKPCIYRVFFMSCCISCCIASSGYRIVHTVLSLSLPTLKEYGISKEEAVALAPQVACECFAPLTPRPVTEADAKVMLEEIFA